MKKFQDKEGGSWKIELPVGTVERVKSESEEKFNLYQPEKKLGDLPLQQVLFEDHTEFWELLWHLVEPQATAKEVSAVRFGELMAAECLISAQAAFFSEWRDFFRDLQRPDKAAALEKMELYQQRALDLVTAKLLDPRLKEMDAKVEERMKSTLDKSFGDLLASLDATPSATPGGS